MSRRPPPPGRSLPLLRQPQSPKASRSPLDGRILSRYSEFRAIGRGEIPKPRTAILYPVYGCNLDCIGCEYAADNEAGFVYLPEARLLSLVDELAAFGVEGIEFCGGGEPTLHPQLVDVVERGAARGIRFGLLTNGTAITPRFIARALPHFAYVRVTFDAADAETYALVRPAKGRSPWPRVLDGVREMLAARKPGSPREVAVKFLVSRVNKHQIHEAVQLSRGLGADGIQFKALRCDPRELSFDETVQVEQEIEAARARFAPFPVMGTVTKTTMTRACKLTPLQVTIDARGDVYLCCYFTHRRERHSIGNVLDRPLAEIWASARHRAAIEGISAKECSAFDCRFVRYHDILDEWMGPEADGLSFI